MTIGAILRERTGAVISARPNDAVRAVVDGGRLVGFVSIGDLVKYRIDRIEAEAAAMRDYIAS